MYETEVAELVCEEVHHLVVLRDCLLVHLERRGCAMACRSSATARSFSITFEVVLGELLLVLPALVRAARTRLRVRRWRQ